MVVGAFPAAKLGALLLKQVSKPIANTLKEQAKSSPVFRKYVCMPPAHFYNWCEVKTKMWILNLGKPVNIPVLNEAMAIELGANLLGEGIIFVIAAGILISEMTRSARKEHAKEEAKRQEMAQLQYTVQELYFVIEKQGTQIRELLRNVTDLESRVVHKPWVPKKSPEHEGDEPPPPAPPPPPALPTDPIISIEELEIEEDECSSPKDTKKPSLLLGAVQNIEDEFFNGSIESRGEGILTKALNHIYKDVYRLSLSM